MSVFRPRLVFLFGIQMKEIQRPPLYQSKSLFQKASSTQSAAAEWPDNWPAGYQLIEVGDARKFGFDLIPSNQNYFLIYGHSWYRLVIVIQILDHRLALLYSHLNNGETESCKKGKKKDTALLIY